MRSGRFGTIALGAVLGFSALSFSAVSLSAREARGAEGSAPTASKGKKAKAPSQEHIDKGVAAYLAKNYAGATAAFEEAVRVDPNRAYAYYMLGQALRAEKKLDDADTAWQKGLQRASKDPNTRVKLLFVVADLREEQRRWDDAIAAWKDYSSFLASAPRVKGYPETATERIRVIEKRKEMEVEYGKVRERIEQREQDAATGK